MEEDELTIIEALDIIQSVSAKCKLSDDFWDDWSDTFDFLCRRLELNRIQILIIAILCEHGKAMSWRMIAQHLGISRIKMMCFTPDIDDLLDRRWIFSCVAYDHGERYEGFHLVYGVISALRHNEKFVPKRIDNLSTRAFINHLVNFINENRNGNGTTPETRKRLMHLVDLNPHLPVCQQIAALSNENSKLIFMLAIQDYVDFHSCDNDGLSVSNISSWTDDADEDIEKLQDGDHELFTRGLMEYHCSDGIASPDTFALTTWAKEELLENFGRKNTGCYMTGLIKSTEISRKQLFFNPAEQQQLYRLRKLLSRDEFKKAQERLSESGMRKGVACLLYGGPGTGKTETVRQLARETGRNIIQVDISRIRDKFVGESEKNIKNIFDRYRRLCETSEITPILLFNEADAIINNRLESANSSVEKMDNAIQNIILEELEKLDGILIATTNLTGVIDGAFDRRFLFKIEFTNPGMKAKTAIWKSMLPEFSDTDYQQLAEDYDFSGGQIENIVRKSKIDYAVNGEQPSMALIRRFCQEERLNRSKQKRVGFFS